MDNDTSEEHLQRSVGEITLGKEHTEKKLCQTMEVSWAKERGRRERERGQEGEGGRGRERERES